jgi:hypothetical protein
MLVSHLLENDDDLPVLARIINGLLKKGEKVVINARLSTDGAQAFGFIRRLRLGSSIPIVARPGSAEGEIIEVPRLFIRWEPMTRPGGKEEWVRADTFENRFELEKDEDGDWVLSRRGA